MPHPFFNVTQLNIAQDMLIIDKLFLRMTLIYYLIYWHC